MVFLRYDIVGTFVSAAVLHLNNRPTIMKTNRTLWLTTCLGLGMLVSISSCSNDDDDPVTPAERPIAELVASDSSFSLLNAAVTRAGIATDLGGSNLTVFAPTNTAFRTAGFADAAAINAAPADTLRRILQYHVLSTRQAAGDIPTGTNTAVATAGGRQVYITKTSDGTVSVNGARVTQADIAATNGVIHKIDRVLMPARGNLVRTIQADSTNYSLLYAAVARASTGATNIANIIGRDSVYTIFAPTNAAFAATPYNSVSAINAANPDSLARILSYHVIRGRAFSTNLAAGSLTTLGGNVTVAGNESGGYTVGGAGNGTSPARITATGANKLATNGVVHGIDRVILP
jgi:uncharacterized surface protein with fasciclin (FAS1) repeats